MEKLKIEYVDINSIKPYKNNPRINEKAIPYVANSIKEFGFKVPIVIDKDGVIVAGHTRYKASKELGLDEVPCIVADDLSDEQIKAFRLADNKVGEMAQWDFELLDEELENIFDIDMEDFNFEINNIEIDKEVSNTNAELNIEEYEDNNFKCKCPKCGFKFNIKEE